MPKIWMLSHNDILFCVFYRNEQLKALEQGL